MSKIYTRTGDKGETLLFGGMRVSKASARVEAYGTLDELNSAIGVVVTEIQNYKSKIKNELTQIQKDLFEIGAVLATPKEVQIEKGKKIQSELPLYLRKREKELEGLIDDLTKELTPMTAFILPGGGKAGSFLHLARSICRRSERRIVLLSKKENVSPEILIYFNRLSDLLFTMARYCNAKEKKKETEWRK